jgi:hypothetical protein
MCNESATLKKIYSNFNKVKNDSLMLDKVLMDYYRNTTTWDDNTIRTHLLKFDDDEKGSFGKTALNSLKQMEETKKTLNSSFDDNKKQINATLSETQTKLLKSVDESNKRMEENVEKKLLDMKGELLGYKEELQSNSDQINLIIRQNKVFMDIISNLVAKNPKLVEEGMAKQIIVKTNLSKEELKQYPQLLVKELPMLENAMKEVLTLIGKEKFEALLEKVGYGESNEKV